MGPRLIRLPLDVVLLVVCAWLASRSVTAVAAYSLAPRSPASRLPGSALAASTAPSGAASRRAPSDAWSDRRVIIERNLFGAMVFEATPPVPVSEDVEPTDLPLGLLGTLSATDPDVARAAVWNDEMREFEVVGVGDSVPGGGARVIRIERSRVLLRHDGETRELVMDPDGDYRPPDRRPTRRQIWAAQQAKRQARRRALRR